MNSFVFTLLMGAPDAGGGAGTTASLVSTFIPFGLVILIFYFLIIRPQNKKQKDTERMLSALKKGDKVVTIGGIHGVIQAIKETTVMVKVSDASTLEFSRSAVSTVTVVAPVDAKADSKTDAKAAAKGAKAAKADKKSSPKAVESAEANAEEPTEAPVADPEEKK